MYGTYAYIGVVLGVNVGIYGIHGVSGIGPLLPHSTIVLPKDILVAGAFGPFLVSMVPWHDIACATTSHVQFSS